MFLAGCGNSSSAEKHSSYQSSQTISTEAQTETTLESEAETYLPTERKVNIKWTDFKYSITDSDGYSYEITYRLSPWILLSNSDEIYSAWAEVGNKNELPSFDDWGLSLYNGTGFNNVYTLNSKLDGNSGYFIHTMTDMYYCIGCATIKNTTDGWNIDHDNPRNISANLSWTADINDVNGGGSNMVSRFYYQNSVVDNYGVIIKTTMYSNETVCALILMTPENISPKYPNGEYYDSIKDSKFYPDYQDEGTQIGIIGKDAKYVAP